MWRDGQPNFALHALIYGGRSRTNIVPREKSDHTSDNAIRYWACCCPSNVDNIRRSILKCCPFNTVRKNHAQYVIVLPEQYVGKQHSVCITTLPGQYVM